MIFQNGCYVIRVRVIYHIRDSDFAGLKLKCHTDILCFFMVCRGVGGWVLWKGGRICRVMSCDVGYSASRGGSQFFSA